MTRDVARSTSMHLDARPVPVAVAGDVSGASSDDDLIRIWLHGRPDTTRTAYERHIKRLLEWWDWRPLGTLTLADLQAFQDSLSALEPTSQQAILSAVKSLLRKGAQLHHFPADVGAALELRRVAVRRVDRILTPDQVAAVIAAAHGARDALMLRVLYVCGLRGDELCRLTWGGCHDREDGQGQLSIHGKGAKDREVLVPAPLWGDLSASRPAGVTRATPVFRSGRGGRMTTRRLRQIVAKAGEDAGLAAPISPHWLRHAFATHALRAGCPIVDVQATLGHANLRTTSIYVHASPDDSASLWIQDPGEHR